MPEFHLYQDGGAEARGVKTKGVNPPLFCLRLMEQIFRFLFVSVRYRIASGGMCVDEQQTGRGARSLAFILTLPPALFAACL